MDMSTLDLTPMIPVYNNVSYLSVDIQCSFFIYIVTINKKIYNCLHFELFSCYGRADSVFVLFWRHSRHKCSQKKLWERVYMCKLWFKWQFFLSNDATECVFSLVAIACIVFHFVLQCKIVISLKCIPCFKCFSIFAYTWLNLTLFGESNTRKQVTTKM